MSAGRDFSDSTKLKAIERNLKTYGQLTCEICKNNITPDKMHCDHVEPWIDGGGSTLSNCQILCGECNERKSAKPPEDFKIEMDARGIHAIKERSEVFLDNRKRGMVDKKMATEMVEAFYKFHKNISHEDFLRYDVAPPLPSIHCIRVHWGSVTKMKEQLNLNPRKYWTKEDALGVLKKWIEDHGTIKLRDLGSKNNLPSQAVVRELFGSLSNLKKEFNLETRPSWQNIEDIEAAVEDYVKKKGTREITSKELVSQNKLPDYGVICQKYGSMAEFQRKNELKVYEKPPPITKKDIEDRLRKKFGSNKRIFNSKRQIILILKTSEPTIIKLYGSFEKFLGETRIEMGGRKHKWTKKEIEDITLRFIQKNGIKIPKKSELTRLGLPVSSTYSRYWSNYKIAFKQVIDKNL